MAVAQVSSARSAAFKILLAMEPGEARGQAHSDDLLRAKKVTALSAADRNLTTTLVLGVLRWQIRLDQQLKPLLRKPNAKLDPEILIAMRLGAFQLLHLDRIPAHAAIDESVQLAKQAGHRFAAGMVNAVLRKLAGTRAAETTSPLRARDELASGAASAATGQAFAGTHPAWMTERWNRIYGFDATCAICAHGQAPPRLSVRIEDPSAEAELTAAGIRLAPGELLTGARTVIAGDITATSTLRDNRVRIQDEGSQLVAEIAAACPATDLNQKVKSVLDACAAPGGKTLILAERLTEAHIVACEASPQRLAAMRERLSAYSNRIECRLADAAAIATDSKFDLALADVPCSGTGTLGRNPEIRHRLLAEDLPRQAERQRAILRAAINAVRPRGRVVYSTCSLEPEENEHVLAGVLAENPLARQVPVLGCIEEMRKSGVLAHSAAGRLANCITPEGALRLLPGMFGTDGFFVALLERIA